MADLSLDNSDENNEKIIFELSLTEASFLKHLVGRLAQNSAGPLAGLWEELEDIGVPSYDNIHVVSQGESNIYFVVSEEKDE